MAIVTRIGVRRHAHVTIGAGVGAAGVV
jgi:hypothetical protein